MWSIILLSLALLLLIGSLVYFLKNRKSLKIKILEDEALRGDSKVKLTLGLMFYYGIKVDKNKEKGIEYIKMAAEEDDPKAQYIYSGIILEADSGKEPSLQQLQEAAVWIQKSADSGYLKAVITLASMYAEGKILKKDPKKAQYYFTEAAKQGDTQSQVTVAGIYHFSVGTDKTTAYAWYKVAEENGSEYAKETAEKLLLELSDSEKEQAYKKADEYMMQYGKSVVH